MSFLGVDEVKTVNAICEKLGVKPGDTAGSLLADAGQRLITGKKLHAVVSVKGVVVDVTVTLEEK